MFQPQGRCNRQSAPVRAEQRSESGELEPSRIQLPGVFLRGNEAADIGPPVRYTAQASVNGDRECASSASPTSIQRRPTIGTKHTAAFPHRHCG